MHTAKPHIVWESKIKIDELHIRLRNYKTPMMVEGQFIDYAAIRAEKIGPSLYPPDVYTPP
jgi:hypothetical protein